MQGKISRAGRSLKMIYSSTGNYVTSNDLAGAKFLGQEFWALNTIGSCMQTSYRLISCWKISIVLIWLSFWIFQQKVEFWKKQLYTYKIKGIAKQIQSSYAKVFSIGHLPRSFELKEFLVKSSEKTVASRRSLILSIMQ